MAVGAAGAGLVVAAARLDGAAPGAGVRGVDGDAAAGAAAVGRTAVAAVRTDGAAAAQEARVDGDAATGAAAGAAAAAVQGQHAVHLQRRLDGLVREQDEAAAAGAAGLAAPVHAARAHELGPVERPTRRARDGAAGGVAAEAAVRAADAGGAVLQAGRVGAVAAVADGVGASAGARGDVEAGDDVQHQLAGPRERRGAQEVEPADLHHQAGAARHRHPGRVAELEEAFHGEAGQAVEVHARVVLHDDIRGLDDARRRQVRRRGAVVVQRARHQRQRRGAAEPAAVLERQVAAEHTPRQHKVAAVVDDHVAGELHRLRAESAVDAADGDAVGGPRHGVHDRVAVRDVTHRPEQHQLRVWHRFHPAGAVAGDLVDDKPTLRARIGRRACRRQPCLARQADTVHMPARSSRSHPAS